MIFKNYRINPFEIKQTTTKPMALKMNEINARASR